MAGDLEPAPHDIPTDRERVLPPGASTDLRGLRGYGAPRRNGVPFEPSPGQLHVVVSGVLPRRSMLWVAYRPAPAWWALIV